MRIRDLEEQIKVALRAGITDQATKVALLSGDLRAYVPTTKHTVLVQYRGGTFGIPDPAQRRRYRTTIYVGGQSLRNEGAHGGALDLLDDAREVLTGLRFPDVGLADAKLYEENEDFLFFDQKTQYWWYFQQYAANGLWTSQ